MPTGEFYDGLYVAVAAEHSAAITVDSRLASATEQLGIPVAVTLL